MPCAYFCGAVAAQQANMSFFVTSVGMSKGADLGGLAGADRHCQDLAPAAGAGRQGPSAVNAKDRIGNGQWFNAKGLQIAANLADLSQLLELFTQDAGLRPAALAAARRRPILLLCGELMRPTQAPPKDARGWLVKLRTPQ
jgi:hypothetical protein